MGIVQKLSISMIFGAIEKQLQQNSNPIKFGSEFRKRVKALTNNVGQYCHHKAFSYAFWSLCTQKDSFGDVFLDIDLSIGPEVERE